MSWKDLDIKLKAELIKLGVLSGIRDIKLIRLLYNDINTPTLVVDLSYNETNVNTLLGIERIVHDYGIPEEEVNKTNAIIQLIEKEISLEEINNQLPILFRLFNKGGYISNNPTLALVGKVKKYSKGGYENPDEPPVSESTYVELPTLNILELELLNYLLSNPTAEQEYFRNLAVLNMSTPQSNLGVVLTKEEQTLVGKALLGYNNFRYSHPWAEGLSYTPIIGDGMDLISLAGAINNKDYMTAGLGLGMLALPNFIQKPIQKYKIDKIKKEALKPWNSRKDYLKGIRHLSKNSRDILEKTVIPRMSSKYDISKINNDINNQLIYIYDNDIYDIAGGKNVAASYDLDAGLIYMRNDDYYNKKDARKKTYDETHEVRHSLDQKYPLTKVLKDILIKAYDHNWDDMIRVYNFKNSDYPIDLERVTTNNDLRELLFDRIDKYNEKNKGAISVYDLPIEKLNLVIDKLNEDFILDALSDVNGYGNKYRDLIWDSDTPQETYVKNIKNALKYVPSTIPLGLLSYLLRRQKDLNQYKLGGFLFPNLAFSHRFEDGGYTKHNIVKGDTLSDISKKYNVKMDAILKANPDITDPNLIYAGDNIYIPKKVQNFIPKEEIPRRNELLQEITDYSKDFDYIIEGEKIYYSRKGNNKYVDISHNEKARRNLFNHIAKKDFNGYNNGEKEIYEKIKNNTYSYSNYNPHSNYDNPIPGYEYVSTPNGLELIRKEQVQENKKEEKTEKLNPISKLDFEYSKEQKDYKSGLIRLSSENIKKEVEEYENKFNPFNYLELIGPGIKRMWDKHVTLGKNDPITSIDRSNWELPESAYALRPDSYVGDTVQTNSRRYILPESIKVDDYTYGYRNRGDYSSIDSESAGITAFTAFKPYGEHVKGRNTYIGIDSLGNLKVGNETSFSEGDFLTPTFSNDIAYFMKDNEGNIIQSKSTKNPKLNLPAYALWDNGNIIEKPKGQAVNILIRKDDKKGTLYGNITGGRVLVKVGDEMRLLSGSMADIDKEFEEMKKRNNAEYGTFYTLDNGSYNKGLRTYDSKFTELDLKEYDRLNSGGGNFLYVKDKKILQDLYPSDTIWTPNVRTVEDESYKKGHDIVNEVLGAVFHHTASTDPDLTGVTKLLTSKNGNSAHVVIGHGGERVVLAKPELVTFHAGLSMHNGRDNVNDFMIGIEFQGVTQTYDKKEGKYKKGIPLTEDLINSAVEYLKPIIKQYQIPLENIVTHLLIRDSYNDYMKKTKGKQAEVKPDIHYDDYQRIINKLLEEVYYKK